MPDIQISSHVGSVIAVGRSAVVDKRMKRRSALVLGAAAAGGSMFGVGAGVGTFRLHRAPRIKPKLTISHLADIRVRAEDVPDGYARILFVGNSQTLRHDIPARVEALAAARGWQVWPAIAAANGARLVETARLAEFRRTLASVAWDALVLQDFSRTPLRAWDRGGSAIAMRYMASLAPQARVVLFSSWPDADGHPIYTGRGGYFETRVRNPAGFAARIEEFHHAVAEKRGFTVAPIVPRWMSASANGAQLYAADFHHASEPGAALVAEVLVDTLQWSISTGGEATAP